MSVIPYRQFTGQHGEEVACKELQRRGHTILARRYRTRFGEIDIVSEAQGLIVFTEVKARRTNRFGSAAEQIPVWKQRRIAAMALDYLAYCGRLNDNCRFDVVAIDGAGTSSECVNVIESAFLAH
jgi:putative endonuclease